MSFNATIQPTHGPVPGLLKAVGVGVRRVHDVVQLHHDVGADGGLDLDGMLLGQHALGVVLGRLELDSVLGDFGQLEEADHLEAAGIRQQSSVPTHELV